uniref:Coagulation factor V n=1 Tax=Oncorhynchus mykiss TaxID=8022 RepID=A0A8C7V254_ONCMY
LFILSARTSLLTNVFLLCFAGLLGPTIRGQEGETIVVMFKNMADCPYSLHAHGIAYGKQSEGSLYFDNTSQFEKEDDAVPPGGEHTYYWEVTSDIVPRAADPSCLTYTYLSHFDIVKDYNSGLIGTLLICKAGSLDMSGEQVLFHQEYVFLMGVLDESKSWYKPKMDSATATQSHIKHTINGYTNGSVPGLTVCAHTSVSLHLVGMSSEPELFSVHINGQVLQQADHRVSSVGLIAGTATSANMTAVNTGRWLLSSHTSKHLEAGMHGFVEVRSCEGFNPPKRKLTIKQKRESQEWTYYIAAEEVVWDYPALIYRSKLNSRIGQKYKKAVYTQYKDAKFTERAENKQRKMEVGIIGPVIRAQIHDVIKIVFKNMATRPYSIYPHGLTIDKVAEGANYPAGGNQTHGVQPGETHTYVWQVIEEDEPLAGDSQCLTRMYHSAVNTPRDIASGLVGPLLICKSQSLNKRNVQLKSDKEQHAMFTVFDENKSWYLDDNIVSYSEPAKVKKEDPEFYKSNVMHTINGYVFESGQLLGFCNGEIVTWHVSSVGEQDYIQTATFYGHTFDLNDQTEDFLSLFPMTGETITMNMDNIGESAGLTGHTLLAEFIFTLVEEHNMTNFDLETEDSGNITVNGSLDTNTTTEQGNGTYFSDATSTPGNVSSVVPQNGTQPSDIETFSDIVPKQNGTANTSGLNHWNSSEETSSESEKNAAVPDAVVELSSESSEFSNETTDANPAAANLSLSTNQQPDSSSEEILSQSSESSKEEVVIYLRNNRSEVIRTISVDLQGEHWGYEGTHGMVPMEMPDHMIKYIGNELPELPNTLEPSPTPEIRKPNIKVVHRRQRPRKGYAMKTKKKKEYKPQPPRGRSFSPRGFKPPPITGQTPRGTRPISSEEDFSNKAIVIGVPRPDFSDYEIYVQTVSAREEYEYVDYIDPYKEKEDMHDLTLDENAKYFLKMAGDNVRTYFITAEEVQWDYGGYGQKMDKTQKADRSTRFTKVVFRGYLDSTFSTPDIRGEMDEHLGILGPVIKAEVGQTIMVFFRNLASRPYSLHANGVSYTKQTEGLSYEDESKYWYKYDNEVQPNTTYTYLWKVNANVGPTGDESDCRTWAYYSGVNPEKDINSGLIGPLLVCRKGTLSTKAVDMREFMLLFMTFDESKSWYYEKNHEIMERKNKRARVMDHDFTAINGIIFSLKGLRMYTNQTVRWHLSNMGSPRDLHSVHFHGQTFIHKQTRDHTQAVYPLLPGGFATLEMLPSKPGLWQLESEVGLSQQRGMQTLFLVLDNKCYHPLGLISGSVKDNQITANDKRGYWEPHLARLNNQGKYNAWSTDKTGSWIQVDFQRPVVISQVATQGAKQMFSSHYMVNYTISYSTDKKKWIYYKGDSNEFRMTFTGNEEAHQVKVNTLFPPLIGRFIRLHPLHSHNSPMVRMEYYGCELDGCSVPLGMESRRIEDHRITASSTASSWYSGSWQASLARLNTQGTINAWQAKNNNMNQWLQVELAQVKKITGIITQGAKSLGTEMYVICYTLEYSDDGLHWMKYTDDDENMAKTFPGNTDNNGHVKNYIYPPIFSRFIRVIPQSWKTSITLRIELLGCDFE